MEVTIEKAMRESGASVGIKAENISYSYGERNVIEKISFAIPANQVWGLIGRSGIGKTTLLNIILGLFSPKSGEVLTSLGPVRGPGQIRGAVFQEPSLLGWLPVLENVLFPRHRNPGHELAERARELLRTLGLGDIGAYYPKQLSAGMAKRVELARALFIDDHYFVADEPFTALDVQTRFDLYDLWREIRKSNSRTGIICTHDPLEAALLCDAVIILRVGPNEGATSEIVAVPDRFRNDGRSHFAFTDSFLEELAAKLM